MKLLKRLVLAGIAVVVLLGLLAYFTIKIAFPPQKIRQLVHDQGMAALGREVSVGDVSIRLLPNLMVSVQDIQLANAPGFSREPAVQLREIVLSINMMSLLRLSPDIKEIKLVNPEILFEVGKDGHNNFEGLGGSKKENAEVPASVQAPELPAAVALRSFVIVDGRVRYHDAKSGRDLTLDKINQKVSLELDPALRNAHTEGRLVIAEVMVKDSASGLRKGDVKISLMHDLRLDLPNEKLRIKALELGFQDIKVTVAGEVSRFVKGPLHLDIQVASTQINLASVLKEIPASLSPDIPKLSLTGKAALDIKIQGPLDSASLPDLNGHFLIENAHIGHRDVAVGVDGLGLRVDFIGDTVSLPHLGFTMGENPVRMMAKLHGWHKSKLVLDGLQIDAALELYPLVSLGQRMGFVPEALAIGGSIKAALQASGPLDPKTPEAIRASGQVDVKALTVKSPDLPAPVQLDGKTVFDNDRIVQDHKVLIGKSDISAHNEVRNWQAMAFPKQAGGSRTKVIAQIKSSNLDLDEIKPKSKATPEVESAPMSRYPALPPVDADIDLTLARTHLMGLDMTAFTAKSKLVGSLLTSDIKGQLYSGGFNSGLRLDLKDSTNADVGLKFNMNKVEANDFISRLNDQIPGNTKLVKGLAKLDSAIFGKLNLNLDVKTSGLPQDFAQNLTGGILFLMTDGKILETGLTSGFSGALSKVNNSLGFKEMVFGLFKADLAADKGKLLVRDAKINSGSVGSVSAKGSVGLDNSLDLQLDQALPAAASKAVLGASSAATSAVAKLAGISEIGQVGLFPKNAQGQALLYFAVVGTVSHPEFKLDVKRMAAEANSGAKAALSSALDAKKAELKAQFDAKKQELENQARAKADSVKQALQAQAEAEKKKATDQVKDKAKGEAKKALKSIGL